jgi:hypothetical protein
VVVVAAGVAAVAWAENASETLASQSGARMPHARGWGVQQRAPPHRTQTPVRKRRTTPLRRLPAPQHAQWRTRSDYRHKLGACTSSARCGINAHTKMMKPKTRNYPRQTRFQMCKRVGAKMFFAKSVFSFRCVRLGKTGVRPECPPQITKFEIHFLKFPILIFWLASPFEHVLFSFVCGICPRRGQHIIIK